MFAGNLGKFARGFEAGGRGGRGSQRNKEAKEQRRRRKRNAQKDRMNAEPQSARRIDAEEAVGDYTRPTYWYRSDI